MVAGFIGNSKINDGKSINSCTLMCAGQPTLRVPWRRVLLDVDVRPLKYW